MTDVRPLTGWCFACDTAVGEDVEEHFEKVHTRASKPRTQPMSWVQRIVKIQRVLEELRDKPDVDRLDREVILELYLVRQKMAQMRGTPVKRVKEGIGNGSS